MKRLYSEILPSYNHLIHEDNPYYNKLPDFLALSEKYSSLLPYIIKKADGTVFYKWSEKSATKTLTKVLLKNDFGLEWDIPDNHLCPGLTGRINYINWIHEVLCLHENYLNKEKIHGIDIGTGASCIYPLLGYSLYKWSFVATDIDRESVVSSRENVSLNSLEAMISVIQRTPDQPLILDLVDANCSADFCMCNPPFFASLDEIEGNPQTDCTATQSELMAEGGEVAFVRRIIDESLVLRERVALYTSLLGRKQSLKVILRVLREKGVRSVGSTVLYQGKTCRWCVCWSFDPQFGEAMDRLPEKYKVFYRKKAQKQKQDISFAVGLEEEEVWRRINSFCDATFGGVTMKEEMDETIIEVRDFKYHFPYLDEGITFVSADLPVRCIFSVDVVEDEIDVKCDVNITLIECDERSLFFEVAEQLENDILRTNRRWRRFLTKRQKMSDYCIS